ncbi:MAG: flavodoxin family protein [Oscillospiraceae bacterium]|nr:flavodoxin family protein [Oscillospiraceae bacterium]
MKIVILNGSGRKGNTDALINAFAEGAKAANEIDIIETDKVNVSPCRGCGACKCTDGCVAKDDSNAVVDRIVAADLIVFASPIYWWGVTAQLKTVIDKCYCKAAFLKGKKAGLILCAGAPTDDIEFELIKKQFDEMSEYLSWDMVFYKPFYAYNKDEIRNNPDALNEMKELGESFC